MKQAKNIKAMDCFCACFFIVLFLHTLFPVLQLLYRPYNLIGLFAVFAGLYLDIKTCQIIRSREDIFRSAENQEAFKTSGTYRLSRNPLYLGMLLLLLGEAVMCGSVVCILPIIAFVLILQFFIIPSEEKYFKKTFGEAYLKYSKQTRRWI